MVINKSIDGTMSDTGTFNSVVINKSSDCGTFNSVVINKTSSSSDSKNNTYNRYIEKRGRGKEGGGRRKRRGRLMVYKVLCSMMMTGMSRSRTTTP